MDNAREVTHSIMDLAKSYSAILYRLANGERGLTLKDCSDADRIRLIAAVVKELKPHLN